jgi:hypothetical protein
MLLGDLKFMGPCIVSIFQYTCIDVDAVVCAPNDGRKYHPPHVEQFPDINKMCNFASCWIYIGILLGAHLIIHISRIRFNAPNQHNIIINTHYTHTNICYRV